MNIVILTGAGISAESGIKTFRDANGLWENHAVEDVASPEGFARDPDLVYRFYNARRAQLNSDEVVANEAHKAIARLVNHVNESNDHRIQLITQNVDDLHEQGGLNPLDVWHMHGELQKMRCSATGVVYEAPVHFDRETLCECCQKSGLLRPHIVWFGEMPFYLDEAFDLLSRCDLFLSIGTSGFVYPAAQFVSMTPESCKRIEFNLNETQISPAFHEHIIGPAGVELPRFIDRLISEEL